MSAYVLLNLINKLGKSDKIRGLQSFLSLFRNKFNKTRARMLASIYHMTLKVLQNHIFGVEMSRFCHLLNNVIMDVVTLQY